MKKSCFLILFAACCTPAPAQTLAVNLMPDGSRDMYVGIGLQSRPMFEGSGVRKTNAVPAIQVQWSNGAFISGATAGWHLSGHPNIEYGPLLIVDPGRSGSGLRGSPQGELGGSSISGLIPEAVPVSGTGRGRLNGMHTIDASLTAGAFLNYYLDSKVRLLSGFSYGSGNDHRGALAYLGVQKSIDDLAPHHTLVLSAGANWANGAYQRSYFGVSAAEYLSSGHAMYTPGAGIKDLHGGVRWNWALSNSWLLSSTLEAKILQAAASRSPLTERRSSASVSTAVAYRF
ncbi:MAG: MipA/OmpV family protein [Betaproteobacteria bacterium]|nr:MipA/OmpV family protein [Betaproteobacteria bacterium]